MDMNASIRRLMYAFMALFLLLSLVMANVMIFQAPDLQASSYNPRGCLPQNQAFRGTIFDRNGVKLVWTVEDGKAQCGYRRVWNPDAVNAGLAPLIGYFSYRYGASGVEARYNDMLTGAGEGSTLQSVANRLLHQQVIGNNIYLTIDLKLQQQANALYNQDAETYPPDVCQTPGSDPHGSIIVENPQNGEILAMVSRPYYDPNRISDDAYWQQINNDKQNAPLLNRAAQGLYVPGSSFKTISLIAALDTTNQSNISLSTTYTRDEYFDYVVNGFDFHWDDSFNGAPDPMSVEQAYAYSVNPVFARVAVSTGQDTWLSYAARLGISIPGQSVPAVPFDSNANQSRVAPPGAPLDPVTFAASGFGQGDLQISPLTMAEVTSAVGANGNLYVPHVLYKQVAPGQNPSDVSPQAATLYGGAQQPIMQPQTAALVRQAMRAVVEYGTAAQGQAVQLSKSPAIEGGKTGTGQVGEGQRPQTWWISMAPAVNDVNVMANLVVVVMKEHSGEGACQIFVADDIYKCAAADHDWTPPNNADLGPCPAKQ